MLTKSAHERREFLRACTVRIQKPSRATGFFIAPGHIITCAHVLAGNPDGTAELVIPWRGDSVRIQARVRRVLPAQGRDPHSQIDTYPFPDLALLEIELPKDAPAHPYVTLDTNLRQGDNKLYAFGYPRDASGADPFPSGEGHVFSYDGESFPETNQRFLKITGTRAQGGLSGAPLMNEDTGTVCGVIKSSDEGPGGSIARVIPSNVVVDRMSDLVKLIVDRQRREDLLGKQTADAAFRELSRFDPHGAQREWLNSQVKRFLARVAAHDPTAPRYLSLVAGPFFGKSWVAASLAHTDSLAGHKVAYHCFRRNVGELDDPVTAARSIAYQLRLMYDIEDTTQGTGTASLLSVLAEVSNRLKKGEAQLIVIDGLDESFGPRGRSDPRSSLAEILLDPSAFASRPGIAFFFTTRPELQLPWMKNPDVCKSIETPSRNQLIGEVASALSILNAKMEKRARRELLRNFAQASEGLLGLACEFFLRRSEKWAQWTLEPSSIPHGVAHVLGQLWEELVNAAKERIDPRTGASTLRTILTIVAQTLEPISKVQIDSVLDMAIAAPAGILRPRSVPKLEDIADDQVVATLELAAELFEESPLPIEQRKLRFRHTTSRELLTKELRDIHVGHLPSTAELRYWAQVLALFCQTRWSKSSEEEELRGYALRHAPRHLVISEQYDELFELAENHEFIKAQSGASPDEPELPLLTLRVAIDHLQRRESIDLPRLVGLTLDHALLTHNRVEETPVQALEHHGLSRALKLVSLVPSEQNRVMLTLGLAQRLLRSGNRQGALSVVQTLDNVYCHLSEWAPGAALPILEELCAAFPEVVIALARRLLTEQEALVVAMADPRPNAIPTILARAVSQDRPLRDGARACISAAFARHGHPAESIQVARRILDDGLKAEALAHIVTACCNAGRCTDIFLLAKDIRSSEAKAEALSCLAPDFAKAARIEEIQSSVEDIGDPRSQAWAQAGIAIALANAQSLDESLRVADSIARDAYKAQALAGIAPAFARAGRIEELQEHVEAKVSDERYKHIALAGMIPALACAGRFADSVAAAKEIAGGMHLAHALIGSATLFSAAGHFDDFIELLADLGDKECKAEVLIGCAEGISQAGGFDLLLRLWARLADRDRGLAGIAPVFARAGCIAEIVRLADGLFVERHRDGTLLRLAPIFARAGQPDESLELVKNIVSTSGKLQALRDVIRVADKKQFVDRLSRVLVVVQSAGRSGSIEVVKCKEEICTELVVGLVKYGRMEEGSNLADELRGYPYTLASIRLHAASRLMQENRLEESLWLAERADTDWERLHILNTVAPALVDCGRLREIFRLVRPIADKRSAVRFLPAVAQRLAEIGQLERSLRVVRLLRNTERYPYETPQLFGLEWFGTEKEQADALAGMAPAFGRCGRLDDIRQLGESLTVKEHRNQVFAALASVFAEMGQLEDSLQFGARILDDVDEDPTAGMEGTMRSLLTGIVPSFARERRLNEILQLTNGRARNKRLKHTMLAAIAPWFARNGECKQGIQLVRQILDEYEDDRWSSEQRDVVLKSFKEMTSVVHGAPEQFELMNLADAIAKKWFIPEALSAIAPVYAQAERFHRIHHLLTLMEKRILRVKLEDRTRCIASVAPAFAQVGELDALLQLGRSATTERSIMVAAVAETLATHGQSRGIFHLLRESQDDLATCIPIIAALMQGFPESATPVAVVVSRKIADSSWLSPVFPMSATSFLRR